MTFSGDVEKYRVSILNLVKRGEKRDNVQEGFLGEAGNFHFSFAQVSHIFSYSFTALSLNNCVDCAYNIQSFLLRIYFTILKALVLFTHGFCIE